MDLNVHLSKELLALANILTQGIVVLHQAQDVAATLAGPQLVARDQPRHAQGAGGGAATVTGEGVHVISREWGSLRSYRMRGKMSDLLGAALRSKSCIQPR